MIKPHTSLDTSLAPSYLDDGADGFIGAASADVYPCPTGLQVHTFQAFGLFAIVKRLSAPQAIPACRAIVIGENAMTTSQSNVVPAADRVVTRTDNAVIELPKLTDAQKDAVAKTMGTLADTLAVYINDDMNAVIVECDKAKKDLQAGPFKLLRLLKETVPADKLILFPTPGSEIGECPDKYEEPYFRDGKKKFKKTSFYLKWFLHHFPEGKRIAAALAHIALAKDEKANQAAVPEAIQKLNPVDLENLREDLTGQQNAGVKALRDAMSLEKQFNAINALPKVSAMPLMDGEGNVRKVNKPIKVWSTDNPEQEWYLYSISGFMQFDAARAAELGGDIAALKLTAKREQGEEGGDGTADKPITINTNATLVARINDVHEFIANKLMNDPKRELYGHFLKDHIATAGSDDLIESLSAISLFCSGVLNIPAVQTRLEIITAKRAA